jgi:hypothetical protein
MGTLFEHLPERPKRSRRQETPKLQRTSHHKGILFKDVRPTSVVAANPDIIDAFAVLQLIWAQHARGAERRAWVI